MELSTSGAERREKRDEINAARRQIGNGIRGRDFGEREMC